MDLLYGHDRKLDYLDETDMVDFLDSNMFQTPVTGFPNPEECYENDWLTSFLDDPVLNDKMMTDAMQPPCIKSEHSYSINDNSSSTGNINSNNNSHNDPPGSPLGLAKCEDLDTEFFCSSSALDLTMKASSASHPKTADAIISSDAFLNSSSSSSSSSSLTSSSLSSSSLSSSSPSSLLSITKVDPDAVSAVSTSASTTATAIISGQQQQQHQHQHHHQPTIIVTTTSSPSLSPSSSSSSTNQLVGSTYLSSELSLPAIQIKQEPLDQIMEQTVGLESIALPPTPPGSSGSDSEGSQSPQRSAPSSPVRYSSSLRHHHHSSPLSPSKPYSQPLFVNPISQSGVLLLSEEEKRTLISEGYPIPTKLPLTKQEEKNLKKIRRKIKNKISAQESRRKKKEYLEALEKRVEAYNHENSDLKKKVESLESSNRSLIGQLQKLQSLVKMPKASQTGTALMVLVFCFAVFLGSMSPSSLNIGYATKPARLGFVPHIQQQQPETQRNFYGPEMNPMLMTAHDTSDPYDAADPYLTPKLKSRMLMSVEQEEHCDDFRGMPWDSAPSCPMSEGDQRGTLKGGLDLDNYAERDEPTPVPGIQLMAGADLPDNLKTTADTTVIMVMAAGMDNNSNSEDTMMRTAVVPDVAINNKDMMPGEHLMTGNFTAELETA